MKYYTDPYFKRNPLLKYDFCPVCFSISSYAIDEGKEGNWHPGGKNLYPYCKNCGWKGDWDDCLDEDEAKSAKRTKIIDDFLNEKIQRG